ncbi:ROK family transcriptional regulator [Nocardioides rubriscoriae]|uniref:ROK family transcriptional regulator n=1 Tax=Nocardioides rubriscoriae TaxID=642762 RepID=UPI0011E05B59|nr:ROK family transcriptional regulator [Nocardioides rubriscoriae]
MTTAGDVLQLVRRGQADSRSDLVRLTGLSRTAVNARLAALEDAGLVVAGDDLASTGGRPAAALRLNAGAGVVLAAAIGRSRCQLAVFDLGGAELAEASVDHEVGAPPDVVMPRVADQLARLVAGLGTELGSARPVLGTGISLPGTVDPVRGVSIDSPAMAGWDRVDLVAYLESGLAEQGPGATYVANDADVLARSERLGHAAVHRDLLVLKASTGLGLGILAEGRVVSGHLGAAGEIGHTKVDAAAGRPCRCGDVGCLETIAAGWALVASLQEAGHPVGHVRDLAALAVAGDAEAKHHLRESGRRLGEVLAVAINILNPEAVVIGGDMAAAFDVYAAGVRESVYARASALATRDLRFLPSTYGDRAGLVGCASMALDRVLSPAAVDARLATAGRVASGRLTTGPVATGRVTTG